LTAALAQAEHLGPEVFQAIDPAQPAARHLTEAQWMPSTRGPDTKISRNGTGFGTSGKRSNRA
jgi:hypothetical protein